MAEHDGWGRMKGHLLESLSEKASLLPLRNGWGHPSPTKEWRVTCSCGFIEKADSEFVAISRFFDHQLRTRRDK